MHEGKLAVVTGAAAGLGRAYAEQLAQDGARVVLADLADASPVAKAIEAGGAEARAVRCNVADPDNVADLARVVTKLGGCQILVNNAGISPSIAWKELTFEDWRQTLATNLDSMYLTCRALTPSMVEQGWGRVVNITSNTWGMVIGGFVHYVASKGGVIGFTRALATELGQDGVTVNAVAPGLTKTETTKRMWAGTDVFDVVAAQQAIKRPGETEDLAGVVSFLASEQARFVTAQTLYVDGGLVRAA